MAETRAQANRRIRQEALREQLEAQGHHQHVTDLLTDLANLEREYSASEIQRLKIVIDTKLALIKKYLPEEKYLELTGANGGPVQTTSINFVPRGKDS